MICFDNDKFAVRNITPFVLYIKTDARIRLNIPMSLWIRVFPPAQAVENGCIFLVSWSRMLAQFGCVLEISVRPMRVTIVSDHLLWFLL